MPEATQPLHIFVIYAREDGAALLEFKKSLVPLERRGEVAIWYDGEITAGQEWEAAIKKNLQAADIIVLLLSNDFFNSDYIEKKELRDAFARHARGEVVVTPVVVRHCLWQEHPQIERLQVLPDNAAPVFSKKHWDGPDEAFMNVAGGIAKVARDILKKRQVKNIELIEAEENRLIEAELKKAAAEYDHGNFESAFIIFDRCKESPFFSGEFQLRLGIMYNFGQFVSVDYQKAKTWYERAAEKGNTAAMFNLGLLYENGEGVTQDHIQARLWYEKAAEKGDSIAMYNVGWLYGNGENAMRDYAQARLWYEKAAAKGHSLAMISLGDLFREGLGVPQNYDAAKIWYEKGAKKGDSLAMNALGMLYEYGDGVTQNYDTARIWYEKSAEKGQTTAMENLANLYKNGLGVAKNKEKAKYWYDKAKK